MTIKHTQFKAGGDKRLYHTVARQISDFIREGNYPPGSRLPGERDLAKQFEVSRVTIREAQIALEAIGVLDIRIGSGVYVLSPEPERKETFPAISAFELTEARSLIESEAAALAATTINDDELDTLEAIVEMMADESSPDSAIEHDADRDFHLTIARATKNASLVDIVERLWRMRTEVPEIAEAYDSICEMDQDSRLKEHKDIVIALREREPGKARAAMQQHFRCILESMLRATEELAIKEVRARVRESRERYLVQGSKVASALSDDPGI